MKKQRTSTNHDTKPPTCQHGKAGAAADTEPPDGDTLERAASLFRALGDTPRLRMLCHLMAGECCVGDLVQRLGEKFSTVSQRLRLLRAEGLVKRRREQSHVYYTLADGHVAQLIRNAVEHADE
jgi:ArsR family transcriptional regulator, lead/cadmium/zinc/bismuth-responsive transcriptional repressor